MQKRTFISELGYQTPTLDLYTAPVENGFVVSDFTTGDGGIDDGTEDDWGTLN